MFPPPETLELILVLVLVAVMLAGTWRRTHRGR